MFRKLVSNLAFSPALVGQLGFYAKRLRKEEATRRVGLIFTVLALVVQSFAVFSPPEAANASSPSNFIPGGVNTLPEYMRHYDQNTNNMKDLFTSLGITRADINAAKATTINSKQVYSWGLTSHFSQAQGERTYNVKTSNGGVRTFYYRPLSLWDSLPYTIKNGSSYQGFSGVASNGMWFGITKVCGNLVLKVIPPAPKCPTGMTGTYPNCTIPPKMCTYPGKTHLQANDPNCKPVPKCTYPGKTTLPANDPNCKPDPKCTYPGKTNLPANDPNCKPDPVAACSSLTVTKLFDAYQLEANSSTVNGATVSSYVYTIKKDGKVVDTITRSANGKLTDTVTTKQTTQGNYTVELTVKTSLGDRTAPTCVKTFSIPAPEMCPQNPKLRKDSPECQPCSGDSTLWIKDEKCSATVFNTKTAKNTTQGDVDATKTTAKAGDKIVYTLNMANTGKAPIDVTPTENLTDVSEYAQVIDAGGGAFNATTKTLTWPAVTLKPGDKQTRMFTVKVVDIIPAMGTGVSDRTSFDCRMDNTFGNNLRIPVDCPVQKQIVERTVSELPHTGPRENMLFASVIFAIVAFFYARSRQMKKEIRLIRRDLNAGTI